SWTPVSPNENDNITLSATVKNIGDLEAGATTVNFYLNDTKAGSSPVGPLAAGASSTVTLHAGIKTAGSYSVSAKVDEDNEIMEQNNENNSYSHPAPLVIGALESSDLIGTVQWSPATPVAGNA
ncbi:glycosyl hydrolase, partial [Clostridium perfringens]